MDSIFGIFLEPKKLSTAMVFASLLLLLLHGLLKYFKRESSHHLEQLYNDADIPRVRGLPIVGTLFEFIIFGSAQQLHKYIDRRHRQYGEIFCESIGGATDGVFISSAKLMKAMFSNEGTYPKHPLPEAWVIYNKTFSCQRGLFFMEGEEWLHNRRILNRIMLNGNLNWMNPYIINATKKLTNKWRIFCSTIDSNYVVENLELQLYRWSIDVIISIIFGDTFEKDVILEERLHNYSKIVHKIFESTSALMNFPPKLAKVLNLKMWSEFEQNVNEILRKGHDIVDMCVAKHPSEDGLYTKLMDAGISPDLLKRLFVDLIIAAGDTTAFSSAWTLYLLSQNEELQQSIYDECSANIDNYNTPLLRGLIKETLRLYPVAPFIGRYMPDDVNIGRYNVKKDTLVLLSLYTAGRDAKFFPDPLRVMPERWLCSTEKPSDVKSTLKVHETLPFAMGNRSCIGRKIAIFQLQCLAKEVCKSFEINCVNSTSIESVLRLVVVPNHPLKLSLTMRTE